MLASVASRAGLIAGPFIRTVPQLLGVFLGAADKSSHLSASHASYVGTMQQEVDAILDATLEQVASANADYVGPGKAPNPGRVGALPDFAAFDAMAKAFEAGVAEAGGDEGSFQDALERLRSIGQRVVLRPSETANPFDEGQVVATDASVTVALREHQVRSFTAFLPYAAGEGGQHIAFRLGGAASSRFKVLLAADELVLGPDGEFDLVVEEGSRQVTFSLVTHQDVDVDESLQLSAQLVDATGVATHQSHLEVAIEFDAVAEPATDPTQLRTGTSRTTIARAMRPTGRSSARLAPTASRALPVATSSTRTMATT